MKQITDSIVPKSETKEINELKAGSYISFSLLYKRYSPRLYSFIYDLTKSRILTKDLLQETFIQLWQHHSNIDSSRSFHSYLFTIARNLVYNEFSRQLRHPQMSDYMNYCNDWNISECTTDRMLDFDEFIQSLNIAKQKLSPNVKEVFELIKEQGFTVAEVAQMKGLSEQTVRNQLSQSLILLRKELAHYSPLLLLIFLS